MPAFSIRLFGKFRIESQAQPRAELEAGKAQELLSYLLVHRDRPHARETLAGLLWSDATAERSKKYLRQALWQLQCALDSQGADAQFLAAEHDWVQLVVGDQLWLDVAVFEEACAQSQGVRGRELDAERARLLREACALYRGDLLEGWYQDWCLFERERLQNVYLTLLDKLLGHAAAHGDYEAGQVYGARLLRHDRAHERTHRQLMRLHYRAGDRTAAIRQYESCRDALREELDVKPDRRTHALYEQIRADRLDDPPAPRGPAAPDNASAPEPAAEKSNGPDRAASLPAILTRLRQLQLVLADVQQLVHDDIRAVELALKRKTGRILNRQP
jgi:DNA-binding SARP family transcriptional activator